MKQITQKKRMFCLLRLESGIRLESGLKLKLGNN